MTDETKRLLDNMGGAQVPIPPKPKKEIENDGRSFLDSVFLYVVGALIMIFLIWPIKLFAWFKEHTYDKL